VLYHLVLNQPFLYWVFSFLLLFSYVHVHVWDRVSWTLHSGWLQTWILLISACRVTRITGMSQWCQACCCVLPFSKFHIMVPVFK
jgi:hypothetical protein